MNYLLFIEIDKTLNTCKNFMTDFKIIHLCEGPALVICHIPKSVRKIATSFEAIFSQESIIFRDFFIYYLQCDIWYCLF